MTVALAVAVVAALVDGPHDVLAAWPFLLAGVLAPGLSQLFFTFAIRTVGASRTSVVVGAAPLAAVAVAFLVLGEPVSAPLIVGALLIVSGGVALVFERRPDHLRASGLVLAGICTPLFAARDNLVAPSLRNERRPADGGGSGDARSWRARRDRVRQARARSHRARRVRAGGALLRPLVLCLFEAYYRGRVSVVSPLVATETLWGVGLSALLLRRTEFVGGRLVAGAALIVLGGVLIGIYR